MVAQTSAVTTPNNENKAPQITVIVEIAQFHAAMAMKWEHINTAPQYPLQHIIASHLQVLQVCT